MQKLTCYMSSAHMACSRDWAACIEGAKRMGFDGVELFGDEDGVDLCDLPAERCQALARRARELDVRISVHPWVSWEQLPEEELFVRCERMADQCIALGAREINMHLHFLATRKDGMNRVLAATDRLLDKLTRAGVLLLYENVPEHGHRELGSEVDDFARLFSHYGPDSGVMLNIDSGHAHIMHQMAPLTEEFGSRWRYTHINDNDRLGDLHVAPGAGTLDFAAFAQAARQAGYVGPLMMEYHERGLAQGMPVLRQAYAEAGYVLTDIHTEG